MSNAGSTKALARPWRGLSPRLSKAVPTAFARGLWRGLWLSAGRARGLWRGLRAGSIEKRRGALLGPEAPPRRSVINSKRSAFFLLLLDDLRLHSNDYQVAQRARPRSLNTHTHINDHSQRRERAGHYCPGLRLCAPCPSDHVPVRGSRGITAAAPACAAPPAWRGAACPRSRCCCRRARSWGGRAAPRARRRRGAVPPPCSLPAPGSGPGCCSISGAGSGSGSGPGSG